MKKLILGLFVMISLTSCSELLYSHSDVMGSYRTKSSLISKFGLPSEKRVEGNIEEWYYSYGSVTSAVGLSRNTSIGTIGRASASTSDRYIKFQLRGEDVVNWSSGGVNLEVRQSNQKGNKIALGITGFALGFLIVWASVIE